MATERAVRSREELYANLDHEARQVGFRAYPFGMRGSWGYHVVPERSFDQGEVESAERIAREYGQAYGVVFEPTRLEPNAYPQQAGYLFRLGEVIRHMVVTDLVRRKGTTLPSSQALNMAHILVEPHTSGSKRILLQFRDEFVRSKDEMLDSFAQTFTRLSTHPVYSGLRRTEIGS